jgi:RNA polymerase sigma-70 factor (ECF subfamily)
VSRARTPRHATDEVAGAVDDALERAWREHWGRLLSLLVARFRRLDLAEDALAEAYAAAARSWPVDGVPRSRAAWLLTSARRRGLDTLRAEAMAVRKQPLLEVDAILREESLRGSGAQDGTQPRDEAAQIGDERLRLIFLCAHPALAPEARAALTLRFVAGLDTADIARLFLVQPSAMAARLTRAKRKVALAGIPFRLPDEDRLAERLDVVCTVIYLVFTAGYAAGSGPDLLRTHLASEAIRLARLLDGLLPERPVVRALLALLVLQHSRRDARIDDRGRLVLLPEQDRSRWHRGEIATGLEILASIPPPTEALALDYLLQARIAAEHATAATAAETNWAAIAGYYDRLAALTGSPVVRLAQAVAVAEARGAAHGLELLAGLDEELPRSHRLWAVRGELLLRLHRPVEARSAFDRALALVTNEVEREHLRTRRDGAAAAAAAQEEDEAGSQQGDG